MAESEEFKRLSRYFRRQQQKEEEVTLKEILEEMKAEHDKERQLKIEKLKQELNALRN